MLMFVKLNNLVKTGNLQEIEAFLIKKKSVPKKILPFLPVDTPLVNAIMLNNLKIVSLLLQYGANPNEKSKRGFTPLQIACASYGYEQEKTEKEEMFGIVKCLLNHSANPNKHRRGITQSPLSLAISTCSPELIGPLLKYGAKESELWKFNYWDKLCPNILKEMLQQEVTIPNDLKSYLIAIVKEAPLAKERGKAYPYPDEDIDEIGGLLKKKGWL